MKKKILTYSLIVIMISTLTFGMTGCQSGQKNMPYIDEIRLEGYTTDQKLESPQEIPTCKVDEYIMDLTLDTEEKKLSGEVVMNLTNQTADNLDKVCIRNYAATILKDLGQGFSKIESVVNADTGQEIPLEIKEDVSIVYADLSERVFKSGESISLKVRFVTDIPEQKERFGYVEKAGKSIYQLSFCFPMLAMYESGTWNENPYVFGAESTYSKVTDYHVTLHAPAEYVIAASGNEETEGTVTKIEGKNMRDMSIVASNYMSIETDSVCGIRINNYIFDEDNMKEYNDLSMQAGKDSVALYTRLIGSYPYEELDIVHTFFSGGMEYPGLVMIGYPDAENVEELCEKFHYSPTCILIAHEVAHQWFYAAVGNDQYTEPWLDESFAEYCCNFLYSYSGMDSVLGVTKSDQERLGPAASYFWTEGEFNIYMGEYIRQYSGEQCIINKPFYEYDSEENAYGTYVYTGGSFFLYELRKAMGDEAFFHMLQEYYKTFCLKEAKGNDFLNAVRTFGESEAVEKVIEKYMAAVKNKNFSH